MTAAISTEQLADIARAIRYKVVQMHHAAPTGHLGSSLSCVDILVAAYWSAMKINPQEPNSETRDRFILSKGHASSTLYATLAHRGFFPLSDLDKFAQDGGNLAEHAGPRCAPGVEAATGSLGHGLSLGVGMALAGRIKKQSYRVFITLSDGECEEGSTWEAAMFAPVQKLDNLIVVVDFNKWQATGRSTEIMGLETLPEKWRAFGWSTYEVDGHNLKELSRLLTQTPDGSGKPVAIIAHTTKGKGVSFMEDDNNWHYRIPTAEEVEAARIELGVVK